MFYTGLAPNIAQQDRFTPANVEVGDIFTLTRTGEDGTTAAVSFTATATTVANVTAGLTAAWNLSTNGLISTITAADATTSMTLTADLPGTPFSVAATTTDGGGSNTQTLTRAAVTANSGPSDWGVAANWSGGAVPVSTDNVVLDARMAAPILYSLNQSGVTLTTLKTFKGAKQIGTATAALKISATTLDVNAIPEDGGGATVAFFNINVGTVQTLASVWSSANAGLSGVEPVCIDGTHASNVVNVYGGTCGISTMTPGDTGTVATLNVIGSAKAVVASGVTLTTANLEEGGRLVLRCAATTVNLADQACSLRTEGSGTIGTLNCNGSWTPYGTGTVTTLNIGTAGAVDTTFTNLARTVTNQVNLYGGGTLATDLNTTYSAGIGLYQGANSSQVTLPSGAKITPGTAA